MLKWRKYYGLESFLCLSIGSFIKIEDIMNGIMYKEILEIHVTI